MSLSPGSPQPSLDINGQAVMDELKKRRALVDSVAAEEQARGMSHAGSTVILPYAHETIPLDSSGLVAPLSRYLPLAGHELIYRRQGSNPQGRLLVQAGGRVYDFYPGMRLKTRFDGVYVQHGTQGSRLGEAQLVAVTDPTAEYVEPLDIPGEPFAPIDLLGVSASRTFVAVAENTQPSGDAPSGSFLVTGFKRIRVTISATGLTGCNLYPWLNPTGTSWDEQGTEVIAIGDSAASGYATRVFTLPVSGRGRMMFEVRDLTPGALTELNMMVQGIE